MRISSPQGDRQGAADTVVFVDTSILIARVLREPELRSRIEAWTAHYKLRVTGTIAVLEFKNRVLRDAYYLLTKLDHFKSYQRTLDHVFNVLPRQMERKRRICVLVLHRVLNGASDADLTERARMYCRTLLVHGGSRFLQVVDSVGPGLGCHWAQVPVTEKRRYKRYDFGQQQCSKTGGRCGLPATLAAKADVCNGILAFLKGLPSGRLTGELERATDLLQLIVDGESAERIIGQEPCLRHGDLLLALESERVPNVYTMNYRESQAYCDILGQDLIVRPNNPDEPERSYPQSKKPWPVPQS